MGVSDAKAGEFQGARNFQALSKGHQDPVVRKSARQLKRLEFLQGSVKPLESGVECDQNAFLQNLQRVKQKYEMGFPFKAGGRTAREWVRAAVRLDTGRGCSDLLDSDFRQRNRSLPRQIKS